MCFAAGGEHLGWHPVRRSNPSRALVHLRLKNTRHAKVTDLEPAFFVDQDVGGCVFRFSLYPGRSQVTWHEPLISRWMIPALWIARKPAANSRAMGMMNFSSSRSPVARIYTCVNKKEIKLYSDNFRKSNDQLTKVLTLPPGQYSQTSHSCE